MHNDFIRMARGVGLLIMTGSYHYGQVHTNERRILAISLLICRKSALLHLGHLPLLYSWPLTGRVCR